MVFATIRKGQEARFTFGKMTSRTFSPNSMNLNIYSCLWSVRLQNKSILGGKRMGTVRKLRHILDELEAKGVDEDDVVVDPKAVHIVVSDEVEEAESNPEEE
jgi:hypothetical protein